MIFNKLAKAKKISKFFTFAISETAKVLKTNEINKVEGVLAGADSIYIFCPEF